MFKFKVLVLISAFLVVTACKKKAADATVMAAAVPVMTPAAGNIEIGDSVTIRSTGTEIFYTTDGSEPTSASTLYTGAITVSKNTTIKAVATLEESLTETSSASYIACIVWDNFEDGTKEDWVDTGKDDTIVGVDTSTAANGTNASLLLDNTTADGDYWGGSVEKVFTEGITPSYISFYARFAEDFTTTQASYALAVVFHDILDTDSSTAAVYFEVNTTDPGDFSTNNKSVGDEAIRNTWYFVEFKNIDWANNTHDFYLDGIELETDITLGDVTSIKKITIGSDTDADENQKAWIDELVIK